VRGGKRKLACEGRGLLGVGGRNGVGGEDGREGGGEGWREGGREGGES
jgi:hypothetical protein